MEQITLLFSSLELMQWVMLFSGLVMAITLLSIRKQRKQQSKHEITVEQLQRDLRALANAAVGVGERVLRVERTQRHQQANNTQPVALTSTETATVTPVEYYSPSNQPYEQAIRMTQTGASVDDIVNICGLSKSEAELVHMMHRLDKAS